MVGRREIEKVSNLSCLGLGLGAVTIPCSLLHVRHIVRTCDLSLLDTRRRLVRPMLMLHRLQLLLHANALQQILHFVEARYDLPSLLPHSVKSSRIIIYPSTPSIPPRIPPFQRTTVDRVRIN